MSKITDTAIDQLQSFGLTGEEANIYLEIFQGRGDTALALSRTTKLARTKVYRILDNLVSKGLIVTKLGERGTRYGAIPADQLELLLSDKELELKKLKSLLPSLQLSLNSLSTKENTSPEITYFHGLDGLKQVTFNSLKAKGELLTYELSNMNAFLTRDEAEDFRRRFVQNKVMIKTLTNATHMDAWTDVTEMVKSYWELRHLPPLGKPFQFEILIYNDIYCMYRYVGDDIFCVEIKSQELADMQKHLFEYLWRAATPFTVLNPHGEAKVVTN